MDIENIDELEVEIKDEPQEIEIEVIPTGTEGLSAYEVAVKEGFEGTESEWLESLKGEVGETPDISIGTTQTLPAGSNAIVTKSGTTENPIFSFGIPRGIQGTIGATPDLQIGTVQSGNESSATITGTAEEPILNLVLEKGERGSTGNTGQDGISPTVTTSKSGKVTTIEIVDKNGTHTATINDGNDGNNGSDGFSPSASVTKSGDTATITITDKNGTTTTTVSDGASGQNGTDGVDGYSPTATVTKSGSTATISITDKNGTTTATVSDGTNGTNGQDGVGVPTGGTQGQILAKATATDYDTEWINAPSGGGDKKIYDFDLPSNKYWSSSGTTTVNSNNFTTTQAEQLQAMLEAGFTNIFIRLKFEPNYPYSVFTYLSSGGIDGNIQAWTFQGLFKDNLNNTYGANFTINIYNNAISNFQITFDKNEGYIRTARIKTANNTTAGNVYDVTYINSVVGDIETLLGGI